jgi:putative transposase
MTNHVHLVVIPDTPTALAKGLGRSHYLYAREFHARHSTSGHLWQNRFFSAPLDRVHLIAALRYVDHNPVRAGIVVQADAYRWSSARAHVNGYDTSDLLDMAAWQEICPLKDWENLLQDELDPALAARLRQATKTGRPCGEESFVTEMETYLDRRLRPLIGGRPVRPVGTVTRFSAESA